MALVSQTDINVLARLLAAGGMVRDSSAALAWLSALDAGVDAKVAAGVVRASVAQAGAFTLAATDRGAVDECSGTYSVTVPAASTLGDPWTYDAIVASGTVTFAGGSASVPVTASGGGTPVRLRVANGSVYLSSGSGAAATKVA